MKKIAYRPYRGMLLAGAVLIGLGGCGGSGNPLENPPTVTESAAASGQSLSFAYFQQCINPIFLASLPNPNGGSPNTCSAAGCHNDATGRGAAFRLIPTATPIPTASASTPAALTESSAQIQTTDMFKNFYSTQAMTIVGNPAESLLINKPLTRGVLHGGGLIFSSDQDPNIKQMEFWISNPLPVGEDEFGPSASSLFTASGGCQPE